MVWAGLNIRAQAVPPQPAERSVSSSFTVTMERTVTPLPVIAAKRAVVTYPARGAKGQTIGLLTIPALNQRLPIVEGTGAAELKKGVGHFSKSVLPGETDNCVLSGHRDTVFRRLGELKKGDRFVVETAAGRFTYRIKRIRIVDKDDRTVIVPTDRAVLTVTTCYPFRYVGSAPDRYILVCDLVSD